MKKLAAIIIAIFLAGCTPMTSTEKERKYFEKSWETTWNLDKPSNYTENGDFIMFINSYMELDIVWEKDTVVYKFIFEDGMSFTASFYTSKDYCESVKEFFEASKENEAN